MRRKKIKIRAAMPEGRCVDKWLSLQSGRQRFIRFKTTEGFDR